MSWFFFFSVFSTLSHKSSAQSFSMEQTSSQFLWTQFWSAAISSTQKVHQFRSQNHWPPKSEWFNTKEGRLLMMRFSTPQSCGGFRWPNITKSVISAGDGTDVEQQLGRESEAQWGIKGQTGVHGRSRRWFCASTYGFIMASLWVLHNVWTSLTSKNMGWSFGRSMSGRCSAFEKSANVRHMLWRKKGKNACGCCKRRPWSENGGIHSGIHQ